MPCRAVPARRRLRSAPGRGEGGEPLLGARAERGPQAAGKYSLWSVVGAGLEGSARFPSPSGAGSRAVLPARPPGADAGGVR